MFDKKVIDVIRFKEKKMMDEFLYQSWPDICVRKSDGLWRGWEGGGWRGGGGGGGRGVRAVRPVHCLRLSL